MVEVCAICDIAGCHHIRSRAAMTDATPTRSEVTDERLIERLRDMGIQCCDLAADRIPTLRERAEAAEAECARLKNIRSAIAEGYNAEAVALEKAVSETLTAQLTAARRAEAAAWNDAIEAAATVGDHYADMDYCAMGYPEDGGIAASGTAHTIRQDIRALRRAAPTEEAAQSLDDTTRAVLDRAERIVAGQSQQERRIAEIFLRPTENSHD